MKFRDLQIGDTFDFISPNVGYNSFFERCTKISTRKYRGDKFEYEVGSINVEVYHVNESRQNEKQG